LPQLLYRHRHGPCRHLQNMNYCHCFLHGWRRQWHCVLYLQVGPDFCTETLNGFHRLRIRDAYGNGNGTTERQCGHGLRKRIWMNGNVMLETRHNYPRPSHIVTLMQLMQAYPVGPFLQSWDFRLRNCQSRDPDGITEFAVMLGLNLCGQNNAILIAHAFLEHESVRHACRSLCYTINEVKSKKTLGDKFITTL